MKDEIEVKEQLTKIKDGLINPESNTVFLQGYANALLWMLDEGAKDEV